MTSRKLIDFAVLAAIGALVVFMCVATAYGQSAKPTAEDRDAAYNDIASGYCAQNRHRCANGTPLDKLSETYTTILSFHKAKLRLAGQAGQVCDLKAAADKSRADALAEVRRAFEAIR